MKNIFEEINGLSSEKIEKFSLGKFSYAFLDKDPIFIKKLLPLIETSLANESFQADVMRAYTEGCMNEKAAVLKEFEAKRDHPNAAMFYMPQLDLVDKRLAVKTVQQLIGGLNNYLDEYPGVLEILNNSYKNIHDEDGSSYIRENYVNYRIGCILYSKHQSIKGRTEMLELKYSKVVESEYEKIGIDIGKEDAQFSKYSLVSLNENIQIFNDKDSQTIRDERIGQHFWINVPRKLLTSIEELIEKGMLSEIAFRIDYVSEYTPAMEEMEFGAPLRLKISSLPKLSKFYSTDRYENNLWIRHDAEKQSLTFEELMEDFEVVGDGIVTQVIHLEYRSKDDDFFINHLDHEFIVYTLDRYQERLSDANIKGHRKIKTFKIDNSTIPFNINIGGDLFLLQVLDSYFKNDDLIREYFEKIN
ncbi:hypothetical protein [Paraburkholderia solisilvae]|uniref:Uncharacterized protein n=1 Tax=Paraburkholderia solisilvae TaxID=624376 RepID=A0A6J5EZF5_9BURK|nr:hypothetical protein [Paraburkholderia solisilvae]CAB3770406.1 hypothetical protein LMG29739_05773 [Paraburkholderia solisilvae]